jgi:hypothetical protein
MWRMMYQASSVRLLILAVPVGALGAVAAKAPEDYDIVIVNQPLYAGGELVSRQGPDYDCLLIAYQCTYPDTHRDCEPAAVRGR